MPEPDEWREETLDDARPRRDSVGHGAWPPSRVILVGVDFSATSRHALAWALEYAQHMPCEVHTVHVVERRWRRSDLDADLDALRGELTDVHDAATAELARLFDDDARARLALHEHVAVGSPAEEILATAAAVNAALVVVGSHGLGPIERWLIGSVAEKVVRAATCPVVVVRAPAGSQRSA